MTDTDLLRFLDGVLRMLRSSFETNRQIPTDIARALYLQTEEARFSLRRNTYNRDYRLGWESITSSLLGLRRMMREAGVSEIAARRLPSIPRDSSYLQSLRERPLELGAYVDIALGEIAAHARDEDAAQSVAASSLREVLPAQKIAPAKFDILNGKLVVAPQPGTFASADHNNIAAARDTLIAKGEDLLKGLRHSNCDPRLLQSVEQLQEHLATEENIVQLGLANLACGTMAAAFEEELPNALAAMLHAQTAGVGMYVAQFHDWTRFVDNANAIELDPIDIENIISAVEQLAADLSSIPDAVDPAVPEILRKLRNFVAGTQSTSKRAAFAVLRTIQNLLIKVFSYGGEFLEKTAEKTIDKLSTAAACGIVAALLYVGAGGATNVLPLTVKIPELRWVRSALEIVEKQIESLNKAQVPPPNENIRI